MGTHQQPRISFQPLNPFKPSHSNTTLGDIAMLSFKGFKAKDLCDPQLAATRRSFLRVGGCGALGLSLPSLMQLQSTTAAENIVSNATKGGGPGWGKAKSIIMVYLQGGPSQLIFGPKGERARQCEEYLQANQHQDPRDQVYGEPSQAEPVE